MIGGIDIRLPSRAGRESVEVAALALRQLWPRAVFEHGETGERYAHFGQIAFGDVRELFVYRDCEAADVWDEKGAIPEVANTMVHILHDEGLITAVVDERNAEMNAIIDAIRSGLNDPNLYVPATLPGKQGDATRFEQPSSSEVTPNIASRRMIS